MSEWRIPRATPRPLARAARVPAQQATFPLHFVRNAGFALTLSVTAGCLSAFGEPPPSSDAEANVRPRSPGGVGQTFVHAAPLTPSRDSGVAGQPRFVAIDPAHSGVDFINHGSPQRRNAKGEIIFFGTDSGRDTSGGVCIGDLDGDGRPDLLLTRSEGGNRLYRNLGDFRFEDVTAQAGMDDPAMWATGATFVDIDGDGDLDVMACAYGQPNRLFRNEGGFRFTECAALCGLDFSGASMMTSFADIDGDGDLDAYLLTNFLEVPGWRDPVKLTFDVRTRLATNIPPEKREQIGALLKPGDIPFSHPSGQFDRLYRNDGPDAEGFIRFTEIGEEAGVRHPEMGLSAVWWDFNRDGKPDLYVANDFFGPDRLYRNDTPPGGPVRFTDVAAAALPHTPWYSMGSDSGDIDNDGWPDLFATDMAGTTHFKEKMGMGEMEDAGWFLEFPVPRQYMRNALYRNTGTPRFMEVAFLAGVASTDWTWSAKFVDLDADGRLDLFVTNGMTRDLFNSDIKEREIAVLTQGDPAAAAAFWRDQPRKNDRNIAFRNEGDLRFTSVGQTWGLDHLGVSFGAAVGDLDGDGDPDLVVNHYEETAHIYRNDRPPGRRVAAVRLVGQPPNTHGTGATVTLVAAGLTQSRFVSPERGYLSSNEPILHFGLGEDAERIDLLAVRWPSGRESVLHDLEPDHLFVLREPDTAAPAPGPPPVDAAAAPEPQLRFVRSPVLDAIRHVENTFDDFVRQPLLPNRLSTLGPGMAWADLDGDGRAESVFVGGAHGTAGAIWRLSPSEDGLSAYRRDLPALEADKYSEDMGSVFFDADGDGDLDLFVVSGGSDFAEGDIFLRDRLYLNDGLGRFTPAEKGVLPDLRDSGSCVCAVDFDRDGDVDLFVGTRQIPGRYPIAPVSRLLVNERSANGIRFVDRTPPALAACGLVTAALWSDVDGDGWLDLLVAREWGAIALFRNRGGVLDGDGDAQTGLEDRTGWWNGLAAADVDRDGDIDYAVTNFGLNTKYRASPDHPEVLYYGDFDGSGTPHLVEAKMAGGTWLPRRGFSCSREAMPFLREKLGTFERFATSTLTEVYDDESLRRALRLDATTLESGLLRNDGTGRFHFEPFPRLAQAAPAFGAAFTDVDADGFPDLVLAQNFHGPQRETGIMSGGVSLILRNVEGTRFEPLPATASGIIVPGDAKAVAVVELDDDPAPDLVFTRNNDSFVAFVGHEVRSVDGPVPLRPNRLRVVLDPPRAGGFAAIPGARVRLHFEDGSMQDAEIPAGSGYLTQEPAAVAFGLGDRTPIRAEVRWADGATSAHSIPDAPDHGTAPLLLDRDAVRHAR